MADLGFNVALLSSLWFAYALVRRLTADAWDTARLNSFDVLRIEQAIGLPHEASLQHLAIEWPTLVRAANTYYMWAHFPVTAAFLCWAFIRHRPAFGVIRNTLIGVTAAGLVLHVLYPLAPPRLLPTAFLDTGALFGPSPYDLSAAEAANQLAAMPSLHVGWALIVAISIIALSTRRWRFLALAHPLITTVVVVLTGNHFWSDVFVAVALVLGAWWYAARLARRQLFDLHHPSRRAIDADDSTLRLDELDALAAEDLALDYAEVN